MLPIRDDAPSRTFPLVTFLLILANGLVWMWELSLGGGTALDTFFYRFGFIPGILTGAYDAPSWALSPYVLTILTSMFVHGSWSHILGNMLFLWIFGNNVEDHLGHARYLLFYLAGGVVAALVQLLSGPGSDVPTIGASGAIAAVMGAYFFVYPTARVQVLVFFIFITTIRLPAWIFLGVWFLMQLFEGTYGAAQGVAVWAHVGGFLFGLMIAWIDRTRQRRRMDFTV
ncbi:MAG TPA: rhomboid family intramembrane serine protease [Candidatus Cryosericum sp.]|nr:rhomboid family intramembrane serine protease [Candidatus Cryosericum sp.]HPS69922.1 rhomboid family intramembrane serine protease [Candidatus Cryosericum sp.]